MKTKLVTLTISILVGSTAFSGPLVSGGIPGNSNVPKFKYQCISEASSLGGQASRLEFLLSDQSPQMSAASSLWTAGFFGGPRGNVFYADPSGGITFKNLQISFRIFITTRVTGPGVALEVLAEHLSPSAENTLRSTATSSLSSSELSASLEEGYVDKTGVDLKTLIEVTCRKLE